MEDNKNITGDWVREERLKAYNLFQNSNNNQNIFVLNDNAIKFQHTLARLQQICPHSFENGKCIYCLINENNVKGENKHE